MKKILSFICVVLIFAMTGCSSGTDKNHTTTTAKADETTTAPDYTVFESGTDVVNRVYHTCKTTYFEGNKELGSFTNSIDLPLLNFSTAGAIGINEKILNEYKSTIDYFEKIKESHYILKTTEDEAKTFVILYKWRSFDQMTVIEIDCEYGLLNSEQKKDYTVYYYDRANDKELTFDEFLARLETTKDALFKAFTETNKADQDFTADSIKAIFPDTDSKWHVILDNGSKYLYAEIKAGTQA